MLNDKQHRQYKKMDNMTTTQQQPSHLTLFFHNVKLFLYTTSGIVSFCLYLPCCCLFSETPGPRSALQEIRLFVGPISGIIRITWPMEQKALPSHLNTCWETTSDVREEEEEEEEGGRRLVRLQPLTSETGGGATSLGFCLNISTPREKESLI